MGLHPSSRTLLIELRCVLFPATLESLCSAMAAAHLTHSSLENSHSGNRRTAARPCHIRDATTLCHY